MESTRIKSITLDATSGAKISDCLEEGLIMCIKQRINITVVHNSNHYRIIHQDIYDSIKSPWVLA